MALDPLGKLVRGLPAGLATPSVGARCAQSYTALGSSVGPGSPRGSTVIDIWFVRRAGMGLGWIVKTLGGTYWYEDPGSAYYEQITKANARELRAKSIAIGGCFRSALTL